MYDSKKKNSEPTTKKKFERSNYSQWDDSINHYEDMNRARIKNRNDILTTVDYFGEKKKTMHTFEYQSDIKHDTNFNNKNKSLFESFAASFVLQNPSFFSGIISKIDERNNFQKKLYDFIEKDTSPEGQFGRFTLGKNEILNVLQVKSDTPQLFVKKMLLIKSLGAFIIDFSSKDIGNYDFIFDGKGREVNDIIEKNRPTNLFKVRGRTNIKSSQHRSDIGILDTPTFDSLTEEQKSFLTIPELTKRRPLFRTFTHELDAEDKRVVESVFVNRTFDCDSPLIGSVSGSTSCVLVAADILFPDMTMVERKKLAIATFAFLVGGGYHSATEVFDVAYPGLDLNKEIEELIENNPIQENAGVATLRQLIGNSGF
ncbi:hypothetical protein J8V45_15680 [Photorhabdus laumondii]|uniref:hypothetical protein n=1 Tax=Photorhabdus laumondii TaxID=2218628 RepID=UPI001E3110FB|nr:hypothetical protein [Photorhabdus laumondii]MCC8414261.1 hypothetical protein [Photorhabdus laumondii]